MKIKNCINACARRKAIAVKAAAFAAVVIAAGALPGCSSRTEREDAYRYELVDAYAGDYADSLLRLDAASLEARSMLLDINSRCTALREQGDSALALYFRQCVEDRVREVSATHADSLFTLPIFGK